MACVDTKVDSEREEGEIIDDVDYLSDISSEEEFLLRQRLQVLESYNNVLERKRAKDLSFEAGKIFKTRNKKNIKVSANNQRVHENYAAYKKFTIKKQNKTQSKHIKNKQQESYDKLKPTKKRLHKKKQSVKINESSDESEDEYRTKRKKLENAVTVNKAKIDPTSLKSRLVKMLGRSQHEPTTVISHPKENQDDIIKDAGLGPDEVDSSVDVNIAESNSQVDGINGENSLVPLTESATPEVNNVIDLCNDEIKLENNIINNVLPTSLNETNAISENENSDEDLELLRQHALKSKAVSKDNHTNEPEHKHQSEEEDSDTAELRIICLRSALLKRAFEKKKKEKLIKRLSKSSSVQANFFHDNHEYIVKDDVENNTDIESVDMDIGSDGDEKGRELIQTSKELDNLKENHNISNNEINEKVPTSLTVPDEPDEDEDLLRAKLLTSISKNLPHLVDPVILDTVKTENSNEIIKKTFRPPEEKKFIINIGGSDSEGEHEATKNLTKMHIKLSEQQDFQQKLDSFLKSTRMQVKNDKLPDVVQRQNIAQPTGKFVPKTVNHLPKLEQIEYKKLVKRMEELEKIKKARQASLNQYSKETLKPRNITIEHLPAVDLDEQIALSRKRIAEESASILKLKEEATKLTQKHKIVTTELRNLTTAINLNKKQQRAAQNRLTTIRTQHQMLLKSTSMQQSKINNLPNANRINHKNTTATRLQKENYLKKEYKDPQALKCVKVSVVNDIKIEVNPRHSIQIDVTNNKKTVKLLSPIKDRTVDYDVCEEKSAQSKSMSCLDDNLKHHDHNLENHSHNSIIQNLDDDKKINSADDYTSPLQALKSATWEGDPNAVLCPFEFAGRCKDTECKFLHPKIPPAK